MIKSTARIAGSLRLARRPERPPDHQAGACDRLRQDCKTSAHPLAEHRDRGLVEAIGRFATVVWSARLDHEPVDLNQGEGDPAFLACAHEYDFDRTPDRCAPHATAREALEEPAQNRCGSTAGENYRLHVSSADFQHGFSLQPMNVNFPVVRGYDPVLTIMPQAPGTYPIVCNEFWGVGDPLAAEAVTV